MRVTFVVPSLGFSGGQRVCATYAGALAAQGHEVTVVSPSPSPMAMRHRVRRWLRGDGWVPRRGARPSHFDGLPIRMRVLDEHRPVTDADVPDADVVIATFWATAEWVAAYGPSKGVKCYLIQHDETVMANQPAERVEATWRLPMRRLAVSQWIADRIHAKADVPVTVIPNGVDTSQFDAPPRGRQAVPTVGLIWSHEAWKGSDVSASASAAVRAERSEVAVVGFGHLRATHPLFTEPGVRYEANPPQRRIAALYASCDVWLSASRAEGFGLPVLEAMACRTPVIATPTGAAPQLVADGGGILVPHDDAPAMAEAIKRVLAMDDASWRAMSDRAYATAKAWSWDAATRRFEQELLAASGASSAPIAVAV